jgi:tetratricopeptide (TPR) repeat protein
MLLIAGALVWVTAGCAGTPPDKIPITTSSSEAMEYYLQGRDLADKLQERESIEYFEKAIAADPDFAMAHLNLALVQPTAKGFFEQLDKAMALVDEVTEGEQLQIRAVRAIADAHPTKQIGFYQQLVEAFPNDERAHNLLANSLFDQQEYARAIPEYEAATRIAPDFSQPYNQMGYAHRFLGNFNEAQNAFRKYIDLIPDDPNPYDSFAELLMKMGRLDASIEQYQKALSLNPNFVASHIGIATDFNLKGEHQNARDQLQQLYDIARDDGERRTALFAMAVSYVDEGDMERAMEQLAKRYAVAEGIDDVSAMSADLVTMGLCLFESGRYDDALVRFESARDIILTSGLSQEIKDNAELGFLYNSALIAMKKQDFAAAHTQAEQYLAGATAKNSYNQIRLAHQLAAMIALEEEDFEGALTELEQASQLNPYNHYRMAQAYAGKGDLEQAQEHCRIAAEFNALNNMNYAFIRAKANQWLAEM